MAEALAEAMKCLACDSTSMTYMEPEEDEEKKDFSEYMCEDCGEEQTDVQWNYRGYKIGKVLEVNKMKAPLKKCKVAISKGDEKGLQSVTNAKHIDAGDIVVVATQGAIVPAGSEEGTEVKQTSVGGEKSEAMLCDGVMLAWKGGSKGVLVKLTEDYEIGGLPPATKPVKAKK
eukprot:CAMPEP_0167795626 /NCGR_PEP_ID=MMETSP0111_2-20121227/14552_1 /TAXON_ID=91324 /ORGANISM="Lotharella globosa, Strain CCCM811" /LENGTH=172 /DNA_ID=CAMNT_0007689339 /DNA_START=23 /DNA_END=541 /DNA_ORIENTATION=-